MYSGAIGRGAHTNRHEVSNLTAELEYQGFTNRCGAPLAPSFPGGIGSGWPGVEPDPDRRALIDQWLEDRQIPQAA